MEMIRQDKERTWYLVKEWETEAGLTARVHWCEWSEKVKSLSTLPLHDFYTSYVQAPESVNLEDFDVHGGITFGYPTPEELPIDGVTGTWVGFDMAHFGDEERQDLGYAVNECEKLAAQVREQKLSDL